MRAAEFFLDLGAGEERSVAATKTYTAELAAIALLSITLAGDEALMAALETIPDKVGEVLADAGDIGGRGALVLDDNFLPRIFLPVKPV